MSEVVVRKVYPRNRTRLPTACKICGVIRMLRTDAITDKCKKCSALIGSKSPKPSRVTGKTVSCARCGTTFWKYRCEASRRFCSPNCGNEMRKATCEEKTLKINARATANNAVRDGKMSRKPCEVCGEIKAEMHHEDYTKPLEVTWLCFKHHTQLHTKRGDFKESVAMRAELVGGPRDGHVVNINPGVRTIAFPVGEILDGKFRAVGKEVYEYNEAKKQYLYKRYVTVKQRTDQAGE